MIATHERFVTDVAGTPIEVLVPIAEWRSLRRAAEANADEVFARWSGGDLAAGTAAGLLGLRWSMPPR